MIKILKKHKGCKKKTTFAILKKYIIVSVVLYICYKVKYYKDSALIRLLGLYWTRWN